ncbi:MAG: ABC transporter substrate-binding protein, partial [Thermomicrobiales bacterium]|nr:ABC transporter substrate-binding protein [Thermomicrobiales bacterium]
MTTPSTSTTSRRAPRSSSRLHRRALLGAGTAAAAAAMLGTAGRQALAWQASEPRKLKLAWNASAICTASAPVAQEEGIFADNGLEIEFVNFGSSTEQLLEAIATGKADAGVGMALRWLKPLEQGFDVNITAGIHGGCMRLIGSTEQGITTLESLRGKVIGTADMASPGRNFFSILLAKNGIDPERDVTWTQFPGDVLPLTLEKGEAAAFVDGDPKTWLWLKEYPDTLTEIATNMTGEYAHRTCCIVGIRGSLVRDEPAIASALTRSLLAGGEIVGKQPEVGAAAFAKYGGQG